MTLHEGKKDIRELTFDELKEALEAMGEKAYRASQIFSWIHSKAAGSFDEMSDISKALREKLKENFYLSLPETETVRISKQDGTKKYLFKLEDGECIESVRMIYHHGISVCISSQVGCRQGCSFCASTLGGLVRNLTASEMAGQIYAISRESKERVSNVVIMGIGEPLDNYDEVLRFLKLISDERGYGLGGRNITLSTCGLVPKIRELADEGLKLTLALSLHAVTDEKRQAIMPVAKRYSLHELMDAVDYYFEKTGRRVSFEYSLIKGVNDSDGDVKGLAELAGRRNCHVNLIPVNPVTERGLKEPDRTHVLEFKNKLEKRGINATIRREMGRDIEGACGQLRRQMRAVPFSKGESVPDEA